jgi:lysozyme family protein
MNIGELQQRLRETYPIAFLHALAVLLRDEGGFANTPGDHGGKTKYGISQREYPSLNIAALTLAEAAAIYYRDWWNRFGFGAMPEPIAIKAFNFAVNMGPREAVVCLQRALRACGHRVIDDGELGPITLGAILSADIRALMAAYRSEAAGYYRLLAADSGPNGDFRNFLNGWLNRAYD